MKTFEVPSFGTGNSPHPTAPTSSSSVNNNINITNANLYSFAPTSTQNDNSNNNNVNPANIIATTTVYCGKPLQWLAQRRKSFQLQQLHAMNNNGNNNSANNNNNTGRPPQQQQQQQQQQQPPIPASIGVGNKVMMQPQGATSATNSPPHPRNSSSRRSPPQ